MTTLTPAQFTELAKCDEEAEIEREREAAWTVATPTDAMREFAANTACPEVEECPCRGGGWVLTNYDTYERCPAHFTGQPHPEYYCGGCGHAYEDCVCNGDGAAFSDQLDACPCDEWRSSCAFVQGDQ